MLEKNNKTERIKITEIEFNMEDRILPGYRDLGLIKNKNIYTFSINGIDKKNMLFQYHKIQ